MALTRISTNGIQNGAVTKAKTTDVQTTLTYGKATGTGDGSTATLSILSGRAVDNVIVDVNGVVLTPTDDYFGFTTTIEFFGNGK